MGSSTSVTRWGWRAGYGDLQQTHAINSRRSGSVFRFEPRVGTYERGSDELPSQDVLGGGMPAVMLWSCRLPF